MTPQEFLSTLGSYATQLYKQTGIFASITLSQAAQESGWLTKYPIDKYNGKVSYNAFGIKGVGTNGSVQYDSREVVNGQSVIVESKFRAYNNFYESFQDHGNFLQADRYAPVLNAITPEEAAQQLQVCGYATDPEYATKLIDRINKYNLKQYDIKEEQGGQKMAKILVLDMGHGGTSPEGVYDPGACGNGLKEADLTGIICESVKAKLESANYDVDVKLAPRYDDLNARCTFANDLNADYFCSIHINAGGGTGFESFVYPEASSASINIRETFHNMMLPFLEQEGIVDRGKKSKNLAVLRETNMPAMLIECLFIDRQEDAVKLADAAFIDKLANEIAYSLAVALELPKK